MVKKSGLGRGLDSLLSEAETESGNTKADTEIEITKIVANPDQPRKEFDEDGLNELAESIKLNGILQPILVRPKGSKYEIVAGERRYQASKRAGLKKIPVIVRDVTDEEVFQLALIENLQRSNLNPMEEAQGYRKLIDQQALTQEQLAKRLSKSRSAITNTLRLLDLPKEVQDLMAQGKLTAGHARAILAVPSEEGRISLANKVATEGMSVRETERLAPLYSGSRESSTPKEPTPQSFKRAARQLRRALDATVKVRQSRGKNKIEIEFKDEEDLGRIVGLLSEHEEME